MLIYDIGDILAIVAFIIVILSVCLMIVSFVILKFSIGFSIQDDFREIGVMKAIGIRNLKIRTLYLTKYTALAAAGAVIGLIISYPFGKMLLKSVSEGMVLGQFQSQTGIEVTPRLGSGGKVV